MLGRYSAPSVREVTIGEPLVLGTAERHLSVRWIQTDTGLPSYAGGGGSDGAVSALMIEDVDSGRSIAYAPGVADLTDELFHTLSTAEAVWFDGTFWSQDEFPRLSGRSRDARDMGHVPIGGPSGTAEWLARLPARLKRYVHVNNTNPVLDPSAEQRQLLRTMGIDLAEDGDEYTI